MNQVNFQPCKKNHTSGRYQSGGCIECQREWRSSNKDKLKQSRDRWNRLNKAKILANKAEWQRNNPDHHASLALKYKYGITLEDKRVMFESQDGKCANPRCDRKFISVRKAFVDHCHRSGKVRGLLCHQCNAAIGLLSDNPVKIAGLIQYLNQST